MGFPILVRWHLYIESGPRAQIQYQDDILLVWEIPLCRLSYLNNGISYTSKEIKNNAWVTVNNDFWVTSEANDFHEWRSHEWKSLANRLTSDPKIAIHGNECNISFLTLYFMSCTHNSVKNIHRSLISQLLPRTVVSDLALWRHHSWSVTSREREILALWRHICLLFLHAQIGAKAIFTSE